MGFGLGKVRILGRVWGEGNLGFSGAVGRFWAGIWVEKEGILGDLGWEGGVLRGKREDFGVGKGEFGEIWGGFEGVLGGKGGIWVDLGRFGGFEFILGGL